MAVNIPSESTLKRNFQRLQAGQPGAAPGPSQANQQQRRSQQQQQPGGPGPGPGPGVHYLPAVPPAQRPGPIVLPARQPQQQSQQPRQDGRLQRERVRFTSTMHILVHSTVLLMTGTCRALNSYLSNEQTF